MNTSRPPTLLWRPAALEWWAATSVAFYLLVLWDFSGFDVGVMGLIGTAHGFPERDNFWLSTVGHDWMRQAAVVAWGLVWLMVAWPVGTWRHFNRRERFAMALGTSLALLLVAVVKQRSHTSCPWDLDQFGGPAHWVSHWNWWSLGDGGPGHCFPGGHASAALAFVALAWPGLSTPDDPARWRFGQLALVTALCGGLVLGAVQTWRGAHPPSHTGWTAWLCWTGSGLLHAMLQRWQRGPAETTGATPGPRGQA